MNRITIIVLIATIALIAAAPTQAQRHTRDIDLIQFLTDLQSGQIDVNKVTPKIYGALTKQGARIATTMAKFGAIAQVYYVATDSAHKHDIYVVQFQRQWTVWRYARAPDGKVRVIGLRRF